MHWAFGKDKPTDQKKHRICRIHFVVWLHSVDWCTQSCPLVIWSHKAQMNYRCKWGLFVCVRVTVSLCVFVCFCLFVRSGWSPAGSPGRSWQQSRSLCGEESQRHPAGENEGVNCQIWLPLLSLRLLLVVIGALLMQGDIDTECLYLVFW